MFTIEQLNACEKPIEVGMQARFGGPDGPLVELPRTPFNVAQAVYSLLEEHEALVGVDEMAEMVQEMVHLVTKKNEDAA